MLIWMFSMLLMLILMLLSLSLLSSHHLKQTTLLFPSDCYQCVVCCRFGHCFSLNVPFSGYQSVVCYSSDHYSLKSFRSDSAVLCWFDLSLNAPFSDYRFAVCFWFAHSLKASCSFGPSSVVVCEYFH